MIASALGCTFATERPTSVTCSFFFNVSTFQELQDGIINGACVNVLADMTFTSSISINSVNVKITSSAKAALDGGSSTQLFSISNGKLELDNITLMRATHTSSGGAISIYSTGELEATRSTFSENVVSDSSSGGHGGAIYVQANGVLRSNGCVFSGNSVGVGSFTGGAVCVYGTLLANGCTFTDNVAANGGAVYVISGGSLDATDCTLSGNTATYRGGGMLSGGSFQIERCWFSANSVGPGDTSSDPSGGALYFTTAAEITGSTFESNLAESGTGTAIYASFNTLSDLRIDSSSFLGSEATRVVCIIDVDSDGKLELYNMEWDMPSGIICSSSTSPTLVYNSKVQSSGIVSDAGFVNCDDADIASFCDPNYCTQQTSDLVGIMCFCSVDGEPVDPNSGSCLSHPRITVPTTVQQLQVAKPDIGVGMFIFANQGDLPLVWSLGEVYNPGHIVWSMSSSHGNLSSCALGNLTILVPSRLLQARSHPYDLGYLLMSNSNDENRLVALNLSIAISADVDPMRSNVTLLNQTGDIVAGSEVRFIVVPVDVTGQLILQAATAVFYASVVSLDSTTVPKVVCQVSYDTTTEQQTGLCHLQALTTGRFALSVTNRDNAKIGNTTLFVVNECPSGGLRRSQDDPSRCVCSPGTYFTGAGCESCSTGKYQPSYDTPTTCRDCDTSQHLTSNSKHTNCSHCLAGFYSRPTSSGFECDECPRDTVKCEEQGVDMDSLELRAGYYRYDFNTPASYVLQCPYGKEACLGGKVAGDACCANGYTSVLCAACSDGFFLLVDKCNSCSWETQRWSVLIWSLIALAATFALISGIRHRRVRGACEYLMNSLGAQGKTIWSGAYVGVRSHSCQHALLLLRFTKYRLSDHVFLSINSLHVLPRIASTLLF